MTLVALVLAFAILFPSTSEGSAHGGVKNALEATVLIEAERVYYGNELSGTGSGFFITEDGFILTNCHVVGDQIEYHDDDGTSYLIDVTVVGVTVVVAPRTPQQVALPAKVLALDRKRDLALLKVNFHTTHFLELADDVQVDLMDEVFVAGFPFGDMLTMDERGTAARTRGYPEVSINGGRVASLRRDDRGNVVAIQTDAAVNPGNSGGPMLDTEGRLVGVVYSAISGGTQIGFAISPSRVRDFIELQKLKARFYPPVITPDRRPVVLMVRPGPLVGDASKGRVVVSGTGLERKEFDLNPVEDHLRGIIEFPSTLTGIEIPPFVVVTIDLLGDDGQQLATHRYVLRTEANARARADQTESKQAVLVPNDLTIHDYARRKANERAVDEGRRETGPAPPQSGPDDPTEPTGATDVSAGTKTAETASHAVDQEILEDLGRRARALYQAGEYETAHEILSQIVEADPSDELARDYLRLAADRLMLQEAASTQVSSVSMALGDDPDALAPARLAVVVVSPLKTGRLEVRVDGDRLRVLDLATDRAELGGVRGAEPLEVPAGRRVIQVELWSEQDVVASFRFEEQFDPDSRWTVRIDLPREGAEGTAFLIERPPEPQAKRGS